MSRRQGPPARHRVRPAGSGGSARCSSHASWLAVQVAFCRCTSATAIRAARRALRRAQLRCIAVHGAVVGYRLVDVGQGLRLLPGWPAPSTRPGPQRGRPRYLVLALARLQRRPLPQAPQRAPRRCTPVQLLILPGQPGNLRGDRGPARAERLHGRLRDAADLGAVAVRPCQPYRKPCAAASDPARGKRPRRYPAAPGAAPGCRACASRSSAPSARCTRFSTAMCTCSCGSPSREVRCTNAAAVTPFASRHSPGVAPWWPVRVYAAAARSGRTITRPSPASPA